MVSPKKIKRVCFDIETELFSDSFRYARDIEARTHHAPRMRLACAFDGNVWHFFLPSDVGSLLRLLKSADEIISFNGLQFDELLLRKHYKLKGALPTKGKHIDLCHEINVAHRRRVSLHRLAVLNLNEGKHTAGRSMADLDIDGLKQACRSDVWQTFRLWELWIAGILKVPLPKAIAINEESDPDFSGPGHHMPEFCPSCRSEHTLEMIEEEMDDMSDGQMSDYMAGMWGCAVCCACGFEADWQL